MGGQIGQQHHKVHVAEAEAAALGKEPLQGAAGLGQQQISRAVAQTLIDPGEAAQGDQHQLKVLLSRQQQGQLVVEPVAGPKPVRLSSWERRLCRQINSSRLVKAIMMRLGIIQGQCSWRAPSKHSIRGGS